MYNNVVKPAASLIRATDLNPGGLCSISYTLWQNVLTWPDADPQTGLITSIPTLKPGLAWFALKAAEKERAFKEEPADSNSGTYFSITVTGKLPGDTTDIALALRTMQYQRFVLLVYDRNGEVRLVGNEDAGAKIKYDYTSGDWDNARVRNISFLFESPLPAPIIILPAGTTVPPGALLTEDDLPLLTETDDYILI